jgi:hypothetical protein
MGFIELHDFEGNKVAVNINAIAAIREKKDGTAHIILMAPALAANATATSHMSFSTKELYRDICIIIENMRW